MLNFKSVTSSEPQIRSNPALRHVNPKSGFQKRISTLLEPTPLPFPTFQFVKEASQTALSNHTYYAWVRPAHLRPQWLILTDDMPLLLVDSRDTTRMFSMRIPFDKRRIQHTGPIICEAAWDAQDHVLWIWDVVVWERQAIWSVVPYSQRWAHVKEVVGKILDCGHPMSDAEVRVPEWITLKELMTSPEIDTAQVIDFQPEAPGQRRHVFRPANTDTEFKPVNYAERKMVATAAVSRAVPAVAPAPAPAPVAPVSIPKLVVAPAIEPKPVSGAVEQPTEKPTVARIRKDTSSKLPDTYILETVGGESLGLAAVRSLAMSKKLQTALVSNDSALVDIKWFEPFSKYEVRAVH
jgi:hypothetical protein